MDDRLTGVFAPIVTVFDENERICPEHIARNIRIYNNTALSGYMPLGSNGEFQGLTDCEALQVLRIVCRERLPGKVIVGGCGRESVGKTLEFIRAVSDEGLDYAFLLPPHYFLQHITDDGLLRFYYAVADKSPIPIVAYNAPKFTGGIGISPELAVQLAKHPNIVALKNSSQIPNKEYISIVKVEDFSIIAGNINNFYEGITSGATGGVLSTASYLPEFCCELYALVMSGRQEEAEEFNDRLIEIAKNTAGKFGVAGVKCAMDVRGMSGGHVRLPLLDLPERYHELFSDTFEKYGILSLSDGLQ